MKGLLLTGMESGDSNLQLFIIGTRGSERQGNSLMNLDSVEDAQPKMKRR
jgi:hypothetical protein